MYNYISFKYQMYLHVYIFILMYLLCLRDQNPMIPVLLKKRLYGGAGDSW